MWTLAIIWLSVGVVVSLLFFKSIDRLSKINPNIHSIQEIVDKSAQDNAENPESVVLLKNIVTFVLSIGGILAWPLLAYLLIISLTKI